MYPKVLCSGPPFPLSTHISATTFRDHRQSPANKPSERHNFLNYFILLPFLALRNSRMRATSAELRSAGQPVGGCPYVVRRADPHVLWRCLPIQNK